MNARNIAIILVGMVFFGKWSYFFFNEAIPSLLGKLMYSDLASIVINSKLGGTGKLLIF